MIRFVFFLFLLFHSGFTEASSAKTEATKATKRLSSSTNNANKYPRALSFKQFSSVLKFDQYERFEEHHELGTLLASNDESWESKISSFWIGAKEIQENTTILHKEGSSSSSKIIKLNNEAQKLHPFLLCHLDKTSTSGRQRYKIIKEEITKKENDSNVDFFMNELPIYNHNFDKNENKSHKREQQGHDVEKEADEEEIPYGACFYGSMSYLVAKDIEGSNTFVTPMFSDLKIRRGASLMSNGENTDQKTIAVSVQLSPGIATSQQQVMEFAYTLLEVEKSVSEDSSLPSCIESSLLVTSMSVTVSSIDISSFTYEVDKIKSEQNIISNECVMYFIEYLARQSQVLSVSPVSPTIMLNDVASWIIQGYPEDNDSRPWYDAGIRGEGEIVQLLDSGIDESSCYLKDASGEVPLTTSYDLTEGKIDLTKRKIVQYVALNTFNGDRVDGTSHGTHIAATIAGERSDDGETEIDGMVDGISPGVKLAFFDAHNSQDPNDKIFAIPLDISLLFYFGRQAGARIHSASWGEHNETYSERVRLIDTYFYNDTEDEFIMFAAAGNNGTNGSSTVFDPSLAKNVISVGASHSHGDDLSNNMVGMNYIAAFSSRGPTVDGRIKPDIVAPGHSILSAAANTNKCDPDERPKYEEQYQTSEGLMFMSGTSMSCPVAVGAGALVRQYFRDVYDPSIDISGTLLKAVLVNGGEALVGRSKSVEGTDFDISTQYDEFQGFGRVNLLNSLKHPSPNIDSPDLHVEDARMLEQGQTHEYEFDVCDSREFRVTIVWKDPPNGSADCNICLINDLDLEVELEEQVYHPNGKTEKDDRNNVERVILVGFSNTNSTVIVRVTASNLGYGTVQKYSLASTGCINNVEFVTPTPSPINSCDDDEFEYELEIFTDRGPEDTSWSLRYQGSGGIIDVGREGKYDTQLNSYTEKGCARFDCFIFIIKDSRIDGICCSRGMGSYRITAGDEVLVEGDYFGDRQEIFGDRQEIEQFCYTGGDTEEPTSSPTVTCGDDEFQYEIEISTDLRPDETRWEIRTPQIDGVERGYYTESNIEHTYYGSCIDYGCYELTVYDDGDGLCCDVGQGEGSFQLLVRNNVVVSGGNFILYDKRSFCYWDEKTCDDCEEKALFEKISNALSKSGQIFKSESGTSKRISNLDMVVCDENEFRYDIIITTDGWPQETSWELSDEDGVLIDSVGQGYYEECDTVNVNSICLIQGCYSFTIKDSVGDGLECDAGYSIQVGDYILAEGDGEFEAEEVKDFCYYGETNFPTTSQSPTIQTCNAGQFRYDIIITTDNNPYNTWWELYPENPVVDSVPFMTYTDQLTTYKHFGCGKKENCYEFFIFDQAFDRSGLCCYFGDGSYSLSVNDEVLVKGDQFQDEDYFYELVSTIFFEKKEFCVGNSPTSSVTTTPTLTPELLCDDDQFEYEIEIRTDYYPFETSWNFSYSNGTVIESVEEGEYTIRYYKFVYQGCAFFDCFSFSIGDAHWNGLCCSYGNGGYTVKTGEVILAEGGQFSFNETKEFCYGPNITNYPSSQETDSPTHNPTPLLVCDTNEFKYDLIITTDFYPEQTSWEFKYEDGTLIDSVEFGYDTHRNKDHVQSYCIPMGCFRFIIKDSGGDGLCCRGGNGGYKLKVGDYILIEGGRFDYDDTKDFCYYGIGTNPPTVSELESGTIQPTVLVCDDDDSFKYELIISTDDEPENTNWWFLYKYVDLADVYAGGLDSVSIKTHYNGYEEPNTDYKEFGCAKYDSCFEIVIFAGFYKLTDVDLGIVIAQSTERYSEESFCHYFSLDKAIVTIIISFSISPTDDDVDVVSTVVTKSIQKILNLVSAQIDLPYDDISASLLPSSCEDSKCEVNFEVCDGVCGEKGQGKSFLSFVRQALTRESLQNEDIFNVMRQTDTTDIFENVESIDKIELQFDSDFNIGALTQEEPAECTTPLFQQIAQGISSTVVTFVSGLFTDDGDEDGLFHFQIEIKADSHPAETSWELRYENGTLIDNIEEATYRSYDYDYDYEVYIHPYKLNHGCFKFIIKDSIGDGLCCNYGEGSYKIISEGEILAQCGEFESHETKQFCSPNFNDQAIELPNTYLLNCNNFNSFKLRIWVHTSCNNVENTRWELYDANGKIIDSIDKGEYTRANATYVHNYCLTDGCYHFKIRGGGWSYYRLYIDDSLLPLTNGGNSWGAIGLNVGRSSTTICHPSSLLIGAESVTVCNQHEKFDLEISITGATDDYFYAPRASWELSYLNGDVIDAAGGANAFYYPYLDSPFFPNEINGAYIHHNCVKEGWFKFTIRDPLFLFRVLYFLFSLFGIYDMPPTLFSGVSYTISAGETVLAEGSDVFPFSGRIFSYTPSKFDMFCGKNEFKFRVDVTTDEWPHETFWELTHEDGTTVEYAGKRYYTKENTKHVDTYCIQEGCYTFSIHDVLGDGLCCSFGEGSYQIKVNNKVIKKGADFGTEETTLIGCPDTTGDSCVDCEDKSIVEKITDALSQQQQQQEEV